MRLQRYDVATDSYKVLDRHYTRALTAEMVLNKG